MQDGKILTEISPLLIKDSHIYIVDLNLQSIARYLNAPGSNQKFKKKNIIADFVVNWTRNLSLAKWAN